MPRHSQRIKPVQGMQGTRIKGPETGGGSTDSEPPLFSLRHNVNRKGYMLIECEVREQAAFSEKLYELSQLSWVELRQRGHRQGGYEKIPHDQITAGIPQHITEDVTLIVFRFNSDNGRIAGYREWDVFYIVWVDRNLTLYKHS